MTYQALIAIGVYNKVFYNPLNYSIILWCVYIDITSLIKLKEKTVAESLSILFI